MPWWPRQLHLLSQPKHLLAFSAQQNFHSCRGLPRACHACCKVSTHSATAGQLQVDVSTSLVAESIKASWTQLAWLLWPEQLVV